MSFDLRRLTAGLPTLSEAFANFSANVAALNASMPTAQQAMENLRHNLGLADISDDDDEPGRASEL